MPSTASEAEVLAKILLIQSVVGQFTRTEDVRGFVIRGLEQLPGVATAHYAPAGASAVELSSGEDGSKVYPLKQASHHHGYLVVELADPSVFRPHAAHVTNLCFMVAVALEAQRQRLINEEHQHSLEGRVAERTKQLTEEVAERMAAEATAHAERARAERYLEVSEAIIVELDQYASIEVISERACRVLGYRAAELVGQNWIDTAIPREDRNEVRRAFQRVLAGRNNISYFENFILTRSGETRLFRWHNAVRRAQDGGIIGTLSSGIDITENRRLLENAQRMEKLESLGVLAGGIAHDFNNLLGALFNQIELASETCQPGSEELECLREALRAHGRAKSLSQQLLTFAKGGAPVLQPGTISQMLIETTSFSLSGSGVEVKHSIPDDLHCCEFDYGQLSRVFDNIAHNAAHAMKGKGVLTVRAKNVRVKSGEEPGLAEGNYVQIALTDTGPGIPRELLTSIFDPFFTTKATGSGLGLAASHSIVQRHHGTITVESAPGKGTTFYVWLPARCDVPKQSAASPIALRRGKGTVLVMDDEECVVRALTKMLSRLGYDTLQAEHGDAAVAECSQAKAAGETLVAMILDLTVRGAKGGKECVSELRALYPSAAAIASSGYAEDPVIADPTRFGFTASLPKPFTMGELSRLLGEQLVIPTR